jgi:hypothetical protein
MSDDNKTRKRDEKGEKDDKEDEKHEEKAPDEKWRRDPVGTLIWACILIWAGVVLLLETSGTLTTIRDNLNIPRLDAWPLIAIGAGLLLVVELFIRMSVPSYRRPITGTLILAVILIGAGVQQITNKEIVWALLLIVLGGGLLLRGAFRGR